MKHLLFSLFFCLAVSLASAQTSAFTYTGHLMSNGASANGSYDLQFTVMNALTGGSAVGAVQVVSPVAVTNGIFTVTLDFGPSVFDGSARWMEIGVRPVGSTDPYTILAPRQSVTAAPYSVRALNAANAVNLSGLLSPSNVPSGLISSTMIQNGAIGSLQIGNGVIQGANIAPSSITSSLLGDLSVTFDKLNLGVKTGTWASGVLSNGEFTLYWNQQFSPFFTTTPSVTVSPAWQVNGVTGTSMGTQITWDPVSLAVPVLGEHTMHIVDGKPAILYSSGSSKLLRADTADGSTWEPTPVNVQGTRLAIIAGNPAVTTGLTYTRADDAAGDSWGTPVTLPLPNLGVNKVDIAEINGRPAVLTTNPSGLEYVRASDALGTTWPATRIQFPEVGSIDGQPRLLFVNGRPMIFYKAMPGSVIRCRRALDADGTAWGSAVQIAAPGDRQWEQYAIINGRPAVVYAVSFRNIEYVRALDADGTTWPAPQVILPVALPSNVYQLALTTFNNTPVIAYTRSVTDLMNDFDLMVKRGLDADGTSWGPESEIENNVAPYGVSAVQGGDKLVIGYTKIDPNEAQVAAIPELNWAASDGGTPPAPLMAAMVAPGSVGGAELVDGSVGSSKIANAAIGSLQIQYGAVNGGHIATNSITTFHLQNGAVTSAKLGDGAVTAEKLGVLPVARATLGSSVVTTSTALVTLTQENYDTGDMHSTVANTERFTAAVPGYYQIVADFGGTAPVDAPVGILIEKRLSGGSTSGWSTANATSNSSGNWQLSGSDLVPLSAGDALQVKLISYGGSSVSANAGKVVVRMVSGQ